MAQTLKARSGSNLTTRFSYYQEDGETLVDTTGYTASISIRATKTSNRVILRAEESDVAGAVLEIVEPGRWVLTLSGDITRRLPSMVAWELELTSDSDPLEVETLDSGIIMTSPQLVSNND